MRARTRLDLHRATNLVNKGQGIRYVTIAKVHDAEAHPTRSFDIANEQRGVSRSP